MDAALEEAHPDSDSDDKRFINRPDAAALFEHVFRSSPTEYSVIIGNHGTGKSTLAEKVARRMKGAIYIAVAEESKNVTLEDNLDSALSAALNWCSPMTPWLYVYLSKFITLPDILPQSDNSTDTTGFRRRLRDFERAAARYKARHNGSCPVLVIDNINAVTDDLKLLKMLQGRAKLATDELLYKVVFVTSDGMAPAAMRKNSAWSRAEEYRLGDLTENEARKYLEKRKILCDADQLIRECGTRIMILQRVCNKIQGGKGLDEVIQGYKDSELERFKVTAHEIGPKIARRVALAVTNHGSVSFDRYVALCGDLRTANLLRENIFVQDVARMIRFENSILESAVKESLSNSLVEEDASLKH